MMREKIRAYLRSLRRKFWLLAVCLLLLFVYFWPQMVITVASGEAGVKYSRFWGGTVMDQKYGEGVHLLFPWDKLFIYTTRVQEDTREVDVLTNDGLNIRVAISVRYQLVTRKLPVLHQQVGPDYKTKILLPLTTSVARQVLGRYKMEALYGVMGRDIEDTLLISAVKAMGRTPIRLLAFVVKRIQLPPDVTSAIEEKLVAEQHVQRYQYLLQTAREEAKRKAIESEGIRYYQQRVNEHMTDKYLRFEGIKATQQLAASQNAKIVMMGSGGGQASVMLNVGETPAPPENTAAGSAAAPSAAVPQPDAAQQKNNLQSMAAAVLPRLEKFLRSLMDAIREADRTLLKP